MRILEQGGNAVDAAVGVALALAVTHPSAGNLGGGGFMLASSPGEPVVAYDFRETAWSALTPERYRTIIANGGKQPDAAGIPGTVAGLMLALSTQGSLKPAAVTAEAERLAREGFEVGRRQAKTFTWSWGKLKQIPSSRREFGVGSSLRMPRHGDRLRRPDLARTLRRIAEHGRSGFYQGDVADKIVAALGSARATLADLSAYEAKLREPIELSYRGYRVVTMPPPSAGGVALVQLLAMLEALVPDALSSDSPQHLHYFIEASRRAQLARRFHVVDPDAWSATERALRIDSYRHAERWLQAAPIDPQHKTDSRTLSPHTDADSLESEQTTHFAVVDSHGMAVSCTTTLSGSFGSQLVVPGTGIVLNNSVASFSTRGENLPAAGRRTISSMAPTLLFRGQELALVVGSPGGNTIPTTIAQVIRNLVDYGLPLDEAVERFRIHQDYYPDYVRLEAAHPPPPALMRVLKRRGHQLRATTAAMGDANSILIEGDAAWGFADPREGGLARAAAPSAQRSQQPPSGG